MERSQEVTLLLDSQGNIVGRNFAQTEEELKELKNSVGGFWKVVRATLKYEDGA